MTTILFSMNRLEYGIELYRKNIENLKWHLENNPKVDREITIQRLKDFEQFLQELELIKRDCF